MVTTDKVDKVVVTDTVVTRVVATEEVMAAATVVATIMVVTKEVTTEDTSKSVVQFPVYIYINSYCIPSLYKRRHNN